MPPNTPGSARLAYALDAGEGDGCCDGFVARRVGNCSLAWVIKLVFSLRRTPEMTREEFQAYWRDHHAPLVARHADALRLRRYVQTHARSSELAAAQSAARGSEPDTYDGQAELWWDSLSDVAEAVSTAAGQQAAIELLEDERRFIDLERSPLWIGEEHPVLDST
jgi:uncharacterized protein (TIGR02118 family)